MIRFDGGISIPLEDNRSVDEVHRMNRQREAKQFAQFCKFEDVRQYLVNYTGAQVLPGDRKYYGVMLVAVYGMDKSICVVAKRNDVDMTRFHGVFYHSPKDVVTSQIVDAAISEIEGHAFNGDGETKPFGFVSVPVSFRMKSGEESSQQASRPEYDEVKAVDFLTRQMQSGLASTLDTTIKTAIWAFKHLCLEELEAEELTVSFWKGSGHTSISLLVSEIQNFTDIINGDGFGCGSASDSVEEPYEYSYMEVHSDKDDSHMDLDLDASGFATEEERNECNKLLGIEMGKSKVKLPRQFASVYFRCGGYRRENVEITCVGTFAVQRWLEEWYDLTWVAVHGMESTCFVLKYNDLGQDMTHVGALFKGFSKGDVLGALTRALLSDVLDFPDEKRESLGMSISVPFGLVSVNPAMAHMYCGSESAALYLQETLRYGPLVTVDQTIQTAIEGFMHLCLDEVKAEDIYVCRQVGDYVVKLSNDVTRSHFYSRSPCKCFHS